MNINNLSITRKMLLLALIPGVSYLFLAGRVLFQDLSSINKIDSTRHGLESARITSEIIKLSQVERGMSVVFSQSLDSSLFARIEKHRAKNQFVMDKLLAHVGPEDPENIALPIERIQSLRKKISLSGSPESSEIAKAYTEAISLMMIAQSHFMRDQYGVLSATSLNNALLQDAREKSGLLRAHLSGQVATGKLPSDAKKRKILDFFTSMKVDLFSKALELDEESYDQREAIPDSTHWKFTSALVDRMVLDDKVTWETDSTKTFEMTSMLVNEITQIIQRQFDIGEGLIDQVRDERLVNIAWQTGGILLNLLLIVWTSGVFIRNINTRMGNIINDLSHSATEATEVAKKIQFSSGSLSDSAQESAASIQETVSSMSEINSMVSSTLEKSKETSHSSNLVSKKVEEGATVVESLVQAMNGIREDNDRLREVNGVMKAISKQTSLINDIVFKTQLLAVNASIESAKAGEHGRGFSVVSDEVSKLAQSSGEAAAKITVLIDESNTRVANLLGSINESIFSGTEFTEDVQKVFREIQQEVNNIRDRAEDVNQAANEQSMGIKQITTAVTQIDSAVQKNVGDIRQFEELSKSLKDQSHGLQEVSSRLKFLAFAVSSGDVPEMNSKVKKQNSVVVDYPVAQEPSARDENAEFNADDDSFKKVV